MSKRERKTRHELAEMIMSRIREYRQLNDIVDVAIKRPDSAPHQPNWDAAFVINGAMAPPPVAFHIITELQNQYDLTDD